MLYVGYASSTALYLMKSAKIKKRVKNLFNKMYRKRKKSPTNRILPESRAHSRKQV